MKYIEINNKYMENEDLIFSEKTLILKSVRKIRICIDLQDIESFGDMANKKS